MTAECQDGACKFVQDVVTYMFIWTVQKVRLNTGIGMGEIIFQYKILVLYKITQTGTCAYVL